MEPVFDTLTQFMGLRKINTIGIVQANKCTHLSVITYNLKKYLKFMERRSKSGAKALSINLFAIKRMLADILGLYGHPIGAK